MTHRYKGYEGWRRGRISGGFGSQYDAWSQGVGARPPDEAPDASGDDYRGRGPRDYRRRDERIHEEACERLTDDWSVDATDVAVQVHDGEVTLSGTVTSRAQKRRAEECVESIRGVHDVINQLRVSLGEAVTGGGSGTERPSIAADRGRGDRRR